MYVLEQIVTDIVISASAMISPPVRLTHRQIPCTPSRFLLFHIHTRHSVGLDTTLYATFDVARVSDQTFPICFDVYWGNDPSLSGCH